MTAPSSCTTGGLLSGQRVVLIGKWAGMSKRDAQRLVREHGGIVLERADTSATLIVVGEQDLPAGAPPATEGLEPSVQEAIDRGAVSLIGESQLWHTLGLVEPEPDVHSFYTAAMLAGLLGVSVSTVRSWQRRRWILPSREIRRLAYFDFREVATARRLQELLAAGMAPTLIDKALAALARQLPDVKRPLAELSVLIEGRRLLVRQAEGLIEPGGQLRFDFEAGAGPAGSLDHDGAATAEIISFEPVIDSPSTPDDMIQAAEQLEELGELPAAAEMYRTAQAAGGPRAEICFQLAELLYQLHDLSAARERYYMAIELDEDYVEARANLGCVLAELGEQELAVSAFEGALALHDDYPDVHYHLGRTLDQLGHEAEAETHWRAFLRLAPSSPWADEARQRLDRV